MWYEEKEIGEIFINISNFNIKKYKENYNEFVQYILYILLKAKEKNNKVNKFSNFHVYMKDSNPKNFSPLLLKRILNTLKPVLDNELINKVYLYDLNKFMKKVFIIVKPFFHKDTIAKFCLIN